MVAKAIPESHNFLYMFSIRFHMESQRQQKRIWVHYYGLGIDRLGEDGYYKMAKDMAEDKNPSWKRLLQTGDQR